MAVSKRVDLDRSTALAWRRYRSALADAIASMDGESLLVEADWSDGGDDGCGPYVQFLSDEVSQEIYAEVSGNRVLAPRFRLDKRARRRLAALGWNRPARESGHPSWWLQTDRARADELAERTVQVMRDVFGVLHPAFLLGLEPGPREEEPDDRAEVTFPHPLPERPLAIMPRDHAHLCALVDEALTPVLGHPPSKDEDGDIPIIVGESVVFVRAVAHAPVIRIFVDLAVDVTEPARADFEVAVLNRDHTFATFAVVEDEIEAVLHLPASPFVPEHLRQAVQMVCAMTEQVVGDLTVRVAGRQFLSEAGAAPARPPAPSEAPEGASLVDLVRWSRGQEAYWRDARDRARLDGSDDETLAVCTAALRRARGRTKLLRKALRQVSP